VLLTLLWMLFYGARRVCRLLVLTVTKTTTAIATASIVTNRTSSSCRIETAVRIVILLVVGGLVGMIDDFVIAIVGIVVIFDLVTATTLSTRSTELSEFLEHHDELISGSKLVG